MHLTENFVIHDNICKADKSFRELSFPYILFSYKILLLNCVTWITFTITNMFTDFTTTTTEREPKNLGQNRETRHICYRERETNKCKHHVVATAHIILLLLINEVIIIVLEKKKFSSEWKWKLLPTEMEVLGLWLINTFHYAPNTNHPCIHNICHLLQHFCWLMLVCLPSNSLRFHRSYDLQQINCVFSFFFFLFFVFVFFF